MIQTQVDSMLKEYRSAKGRSAHIAVEIEQLRKELDRTIEADISECADITGQHYSSMPHGTDPGRPTEEKGMRLLALPLSKEATAIKAAISEKTAAMERQRIIVMFVEAWLSGLTEKEPWIVERQAIDGASWKESAFSYSTTFGQSGTQSTLKRIKRIAMVKIYKMAE